MPIHLPPLTRREFVKASVAAGAGLLSLRAEAAESGRWALIADTHIGSARDVTSRGINMAENLVRVAAQIQRANPAGVLLNGDCALLDGQPGDYALLTELNQPLRTAGIPFHATLGNHDHRENFWAAAKRESAKPLQSRHVSVIETPLVNWFLLDSLDKVNVTPGRLGDEQLKWLEKALDALPDRPAIVFGHHHLDFATSVPFGGLIDSQALFAVLKPRMHVKAYVFGHTHRWELAQKDGIHLINLPPVAYVFRPTDPSGWVDVTLKPTGATLTLHSLDPAHAANNKRHDVAWR